MKHEETEATRRAIKFLREFRNSVIDWCVSAVVDHNKVTKDLNETQLQTVIELLQKEKE